MSSAGQASAGMGCWKEKNIAASLIDLGPYPVRSNGSGVTAKLAPEMG